ncbi:organic cation transporter protein-like [Ruditapes philippinarum]|uniref:organic cation transporter protein-like n=1 Tax=Ruditapes philippinarum TaxID=129788 RepID=UPI00295AAEB2|nr:organic cation transporter protein-like [Ruditapes philippinarum]
METSAVSSPDKIIEDLGGCGRLQIRIGITVHATKGLICFSIMSMILISATPQWWCVSDVTSSNMTSCVDSKNNSLFCHEKKCHVNGTKCSRFVFEGSARTVVTEFKLLCGLDYIPSTVMSMQTFGMLAGALAAGQLSDLFGRKPPYFAGLLCLLIFNLIGFFSVNWIMFAIARLFIGIGSGMFLAIQYCIVSEFSLARWRAWVTGFPSWPILSCLFALCAWLIQDWRYIQLLCCLLALPCLLTWLFALGLVFYGISFGIQALAGNIYLNLFLFSVVSIPAKIITVYLTNRLGRRIAAMICFLGVAVGGLVAGIAQAVASITINMAWGPIQTMTIEVYPTVIRNIGFGSLSVIARFGAILGPQFVYLNMYVPGLLFFVCGGIAVLCLVSQQFLPETRDSKFKRQTTQTGSGRNAPREKDTDIK